MGISKVVVMANGINNNTLPLVWSVLVLV